MTLTKDEVLERYGEVEVKFSWYYEYTFYFEGQTDNYYLTVFTAGYPDDIYNLNISANTSYKIKDLPISGFKIYHKGVTTYYNFDEY